MYCAHILQLQSKRINAFLLAKLGGMWFHQRNHRNNVRIGTKTSSEWKEEFKRMHQGSNFECFRGRLGLQSVTKAASRCMYAYDHQMYVSNEKMEEVERTLMRP